LPPEDIAKFLRSDLNAIFVGGVPAKPFNMAKSWQVARMRKGATPGPVCF
jgi:hypothetical protein